MDGYHLTRAQLADMHDPAYAASRRGAYWTFDEAGFVAMVQKLRLEGRASVPSFDHGTGDPVPDAIQVEPSTAVVILGARVRGARGAASGRGSALCRLSRCRCPATQLLRHTFLVVEWNLAAG